MLLRNLSTSLSRGGIYGGKLKSKSTSIEFKMVSSRFLPISIFVEFVEFVDIDNHVSK